MSVITRILSAIFQRHPRYQVSAYRPIYTALVTRLAEHSITVGGKASYPRVEIHSIREQERLDKDGALRQVNLIVESISDTSLNEAVVMNDAVLKHLTKEDLTITNEIGYKLQDLTETTDSKKILYRLMQELNIWMEKIKSDTDTDEDDDEQQESETIGNENN